VVVGQCLELPGRGLDQPLLAETERGAPQPRQPFDITIAVIIKNVDALTAREDMRAAFRLFGQIGEWMQVIGDIPGMGRVDLFVHHAPPSRYFR